jgi:hypothetical protein
VQLIRSSDGYLHDLPLVFPQLSLSSLEPGSSFDNRMKRSSGRNIKMSEYDGLGDLSPTSEVLSRLPVI